MSWLLTCKEIRVLITAPAVSIQMIDQEKLLSLWLLPQEGKTSTFIQHSSFSGATKDYYLSSLIWNADEELTYFGCLRATENERELSGLVLHQRAWGPERHQREQEIMSARKRNRQTSLPGKLHVQGQRRHILRKFERAPESLPRLIGESLPLYKGSL